MEKLLVIGGLYVGDCIISVGDCLSLQGFVLRAVIKSCSYPSRKR